MMKYQFSVPSLLDKPEEYFELQAKFLESIFTVLLKISWETLSLLNLSHFELPTY